jgi:hypothetical protein
MIFECDISMLLSSLRHTKRNKLYQFPDGEGEGRIQSLLGFFSISGLQYFSVSFLWLGIKFTSFVALPRTAEVIPIASGTDIRPY